MRIGPALVLAAALVCCVMAIQSLFWQGTRPYKGYASESTVVLIEPGQPARVAAAKLHDSGLIRSALVFRLLMRVRRAEGRIHAGEYEFSGPQSPNQILDKLVRGDVVQHKMTVPEGLRLEETSEVVEAAGFGTRQAFLESARAERNRRLVLDLDPVAPDLEGYLFPDTYFFASGTPPDRIVEEMVARFRREMSAGRMARLNELGLSVRQAITLASLVEEEAMADEERARIAAVFHNRLRSRMLLQCDPTVVYALELDRRYRGEIYRSDLSYSSPYNTYVHPGLPPGPICSPGARSIEAALYPAPTGDLYFVVAGPGRHRFSTNIRDHEEAVRQYRRDLTLSNRRH
ncbi:MAG TPA: endolytic transglycosylase MltG [Candidatus Polarisedimenticolia bacterium]|jgi:UPF0755 protein